MSKFVRIGRHCVQALAGLALAGLLAACGGGGGASGDPVLGGGGGGTTPASVADLSVVLDRSSVTNSGSEVVTVTVTSVDANRSAVGNVPIKFAVDNSGTIAPAGTNTDATTGKLTAKVEIGDDRTNRTINVTVVTGSISKKVSFDVVDSVSGGKVADLAMTLNRTSIPNDGTQSVTVTVTSLDAARSAIGGSPVSFKISDSGDAFVSPSGTTTNATSGQLTATVSLGSNHTNRAISVTAISGTVQRTISFDVVDSLVTIPKASDLTLLLSTSNIDNAGTTSVRATVTAVDSSRNVLVGIPVTFSVDNNAVIAPSGNQTDANGQVSATVGIGSDRTNRLITVTAKSDALTRTATFRVIGATLQGTASPGVPPAGSTGNKVDYRLNDVNKNAMVGVPITVSAPGITGATGVTDVNGAYTFTYTAPTTPGSVDITATSGGASSVVSITVPSGTSTVPPATSTVVSAAVSANPTVVSTNTAETNNRAEVRALFLAASNVPVKNIRVRFDLNGDANSIGGTLGSGTSLVYSDASGAAISSYTPAARSSPTNGVTIRACWDYNDFAATACPNQVLTSLTVVSDPLSITIGTNETLENGDSGLTYVKKFVLLVVDAAGNPKSDVQITPSIDLTSYTKGYYRYSKVDTAWLQYFLLDSTEIPGVSPICLAEDANKNGSLDTGDDKNSNGQLDPRKSDAAIAMVSSTRTDANGTAILKIEYPRSVAGWVQYRITASAAGVLSPPAYYPGPSSTESLPVSATAIKTETPPPAFVSSPYGQIRKSTDTVYCTNSN